MWCPRPSRRSRRQSGDDDPAGKIGTGILMLTTFGGFGIRVLIDFILIVTSSLRDGNGLLIKPPRS